MATESVRISSSSQEEPQQEESMLDAIMRMLVSMNTVDSPLVKFVASRTKTDEQMAYLLVSTTLIKFKTIFSCLQENYDDDYPSVTIARYINSVIDGIGIDKLANLLHVLLNSDEEVVTAGLNYYAIMNRKYIENAVKLQEEESIARKELDEQWKQELEKEIAQPPIFQTKSLLDMKMLSDIYAEFSEVGEALSRTFTETELEEKFGENVFYPQILAGYKLAKFERETK